MTYPCVIELLGGLRVRRGDGPVTRFRTQRTGALLAYLACYLDRQHAREELVDLFWPEADIDSGRMSLRSALSSLRRQLEPPGTSPGSVIIADRAGARLNPEIVSTDVLAMESAVSSADRAEDPAERAAALERAVGLYRGDLLPGIYDDWAVRERERLQMRHQATLLRLAASLEEIGECRRALEYAHRAVTLDPLAEEAHCALMRLFAATGQTAAVTRQYRELVRTLRRELKAEPSPEAQELYARLTAEGPAHPSVGAAQPAHSPAVPEPARTLVSARAAVPGSPHEPAASAGARLPVHLTPFFGRQPEKARIVDLLRRQDCRLVTVTGPGGAGKTRLALEVARSLVDDFDGAVWFVPLADVVDSTLLADTVVRVLDPPPGSERSSMDLLVRALGQRRSLLVLDNCEQLGEDGALFVADLLARAPRLSCLVTSRQRLEVAGERDLVLAPLPVPDMPGAPEWLAGYPSVQLFVDRAQAVRPDFQLTPETAPAVAALCERLEGIPLALEIAAAWSQVLTPGRMLARLSEGADLLASRQRDVAPRHRTLRAAFEWSYQLLPADLQRVFARLSVFRGGWTLEAAGHVCRELAPAAEGGTEDDAAFLMMELQARSLVMAEDAGEEMRFRMLEVLRQYADERLSAEERGRAEERRDCYVLAFAQRAERAMDSAEQAAWLARIQRDLDNLRATLARCERTGEVERGLELATALGKFWQASGGGDEGIRWLSGLLSRAGAVEPRTRARALCELTDLQQCRRLDPAVMQALEESLRIYTELSDRKAMASVLRKLSSANVQATRDWAAATGLLERSLALCREADDMPGIAESLRNLASVRRDVGDFAVAESCYSQSLALYREIGDLHGAAAVAGDMGYMLHMQGQHDRAGALLREDLDLSRQLGDKLSTCHALWLLGRLAQDTGDYARAAEVLAEGLALAKQTGNRQQAVNCLVNLGLLAGQQGDNAGARRHYGEALKVAHEIGNRVGLLLPLRLDAVAALHCGDFRAVGDRMREALSVARERGTVRVMIDSLEILAQASQGEGRLAESVRLLGAANAAREAAEEPGSPAEREERRRRVDALRAALGEPSFEPAWEEGRAQPLAEAVEMALSAP